jgi:hypothetical protein
LTRVREETGRLWGGSGWDELDLALRTADFLDADLEGIAEAVPAPAATADQRGSESFTCEEYVAEYGCWKVQVITRNGCPSYVAVEANEYRGTAVVNDLLDNNGTGLPPKTPVTFEFDATQDGTTVDDLKVECS